MRLAGVRTVLHITEVNNVLSPLEFRWGFSLSFFLKYILITTEILWKRGEEKLNTVKILFQRRKLL